MATIERFEDLVGWQRARELTTLVYQATRTAPFSKDFGLRDQIQRAAVSVMSNVAEGFERRTPTEFYQFLSIARASCAEVRSQLYVALDVGHIRGEQFDRLVGLARETGRILGGLQSYIQTRKPAKGARSLRN
jgi:four helix bundle protein